MLLLRPLQFHWIMYLWDLIYESVFFFRLSFVFSCLNCLVVLILPGGFKGGCLFIGPRFLPPWAELADPSLVFVEKRGARAGDLSPWLDPRPPDFFYLAKLIYLTWPLKQILLSIGNPTFCITKMNISALLWASWVCMINLIWQRQCAIPSPMIYSPDK